MAQAGGRTINNDSYSVTFIFCLLVSCGPSTIRWAIRKIIIYSVYRMRRRRFQSHIFNEAIKRQPLIANRNPSSTITREPWIFRVSTSLNHVTPRSVFCRMRQSVSGVSRIGTFQPQASTAFRALAKLIRNNYMSIPAVTLAQPEYSLFGMPSNRQRCEPFKFFTSPVNCCRHSHYVTAMLTLCKL